MPNRVFMYVLCACGPVQVHAVLLGGFEETGANVELSGHVWPEGEKIKDQQEDPGAPERNEEEGDEDHDSC